MIVKTIKENNSAECEYTYSDAAFKIIRNGAEYDETVDPIGSNLEYDESSTPIKPPEETPRLQATDVTSDELKVFDHDYLN